MDDYQNGDRDLVCFHRKDTAKDQIKESFGLQTELVRPSVKLTWIVYMWRSLMCSSRNCFSPTALGA
jgi:hypothetical protein